MQEDIQKNEKSMQDLHNDRMMIAHQWYYAFASIGSFQLDRAEALHKFSDLTDQVIAFLMAENLDSNVARDIGMQLASLPCIDPMAIEISGRLWSENLTNGIIPLEHDLLNRRLVILLKGMSTGFFRHARDIVLENQEAIRSAMAADLLRTTAELKKYQTRLEELLAERTKELRESEEQFRVIAETSIDGVIQSTGPTGTLIYVNNAFARMLGYTKEELLGTSTYSLLATPDLPRIPSIAEDMRSNEPVSGEFRLKHKSGQLIDIHFSLAPSMLKGRIVRSTILQDITESKRTQEALYQSEERYRTLAEASPDMIFIAGKDGLCQYINSFAAAFMNVPAQAVIGQPCELFFPASLISNQKKNVQKVLDDGISVYDESHTEINSSVIWLSTWLVPLRDAAGGISGVMGISRDITRLKLAEKEILRSRDQLEKQVEERTAELINSQTQLRQLASQLITSLEEERRRISRELDDQAGQALISLKYVLATLESNIPEGDVLSRQRLLISMDLIDQVKKQIRSLSHSLRPPILDILGINLSLRDYCEEFTKQTGLAVQYQGEEIPGLPDEIGISLYRFVQETITNLAKLAKATHVRVSLRRSKRNITLSIADDGCSVEDTTQTDGIGLIGIKERFHLLGGHLQIQPRKGQGVKQTALIPWP